MIDFKESFKQSLEINKTLLSIIDLWPEKKRYYRVETDKQQIDRILFFEDDVEWLSLPLSYGEPWDTDSLYRRLGQVTNLTLSSLKTPPCSYPQCWGDCELYNLCHKCMSNLCVCEFGN